MFLRFPRKIWNKSILFTPMVRVGGAMSSSGDITPARCVRQISHKCETRAFETIRLIPALNFEVLIRKCDWSLKHCN